MHASIDRSIGRHFVRVVTDDRRDEQRVYEVISFHFAPPPPPPPLLRGVGHELMS